jgi:hypothetical protein
MRKQWSENAQTAIKVIARALRAQQYPAAGANNLSACQ